ncbi:MAG: hypothetical protein GQ477_05005 [Nanohaloarchaea archaeon]|nr:hypothetical protein [Candidatus Nanohaloarchaea archaeon]
MNIPVLGIFFPIEEAIVITCIIIVLYLIVFRFEFKQLSVISKKMADEESELNKDIKELKEELNLFGGNINVSGAKAKETKSDDTKSDDSKEEDKETETDNDDNAKTEDSKVEGTKSVDAKSEDTDSKESRSAESKSDDTKSEDTDSEVDRLKKMLD